MNEGTQNLGDAILVLVLKLPADDVVEVLSLLRAKARLQGTDASIANAIEALEARARSFSSASENSSSTGTEKSLCSAGTLTSTGGKHLSPASTSQAANDPHAMGPCYKCRKLLAAIPYETELEPVKIESLKAIEKIGQVKDCIRFLRQTGRIIDAAGKKRSGVFKTVTDDNSSDKAI